MIVLMITPKTVKVYVSNSFETYSVSISEAWADLAASGRQERPGNIKIGRHYPVHQIYITLPLTAAASLDRTSRPFSQYSLWPWSWPLTIVNWAGKPCKLRVLCVVCWTGCKKCQHQYSIIQTMARQIKCFDRRRERRCNGSAADLAQQPTLNTGYTQTLYSFLSYLLQTILYVRFVVPLQLVLIKQFYEISFAR